MAAYSSSVRVGPPLSGRFAQGDSFTDALGAAYLCFRSGYPGLWSPLPPGISVAEASKLDDAGNATLIGAVAAPASGTVTVASSRVGPLFTLTFTLTAARIAVTDAAGSGSHGSLKLFDFVQSAIAYLGCRQVYSAFTPDGTGVTATAAFDIGVGSVALAAPADGALGGATDDDIGGEAAITLGSTSLPVGVVTGAGAKIDGTGTAADLNLNWSGSAATVTANGTIDVTGVIQVVGLLLGDD
jgi:hypothetical protein